MDNVIPLNRRQLAEETEETFSGATHTVPRMHVVATGALHPHPAYFPTVDPTWTVTTQTSWVLGVLHVETGLECVVTWHPAGEDQWTIQMRPGQQTMHGLTVNRVWDMIGGATLAAKAMRAAKK